jgi:membrane-associated protein
MTVLLDLAAVNILDARSVLTAFGVAGVFVVLFAETGLLVGFFLPGDSLLFTAGLLSSTAVAQPLPLPLVLVASVGGALLGAQVGYLIGRRAGPALTDAGRRPKISAAMSRSRHLLDRYGHGRAIVLARFVPVVRTVLNPVAGALGVPARVFTLWQIVGGVLWTCGLVIAGFLLGRSVPGIDQYLLPVIGLIVVVSLLPLAIELVRAKRRQPVDEPPTLRQQGPPGRPIPDDAPTERRRVGSRRKSTPLPRVMIVDHDPVRRARLAAMLDHAADLELVGSTSNTAITRVLLDMLGTACPDMVLVALDLPDGDGPGTTATIHAGYPHIRVLTYAVNPAYPLAAQAMAAGASAVLAEETLLDDLRNAMGAPAHQVVQRKSKGRDE